MRAFKPVVVVFDLLTREEQKQLVGLGKLLGAFAKKERPLQPG